MNSLQKKAEAWYHQSEGFDKMEAFIAGYLAGQQKTGPVTGINKAYDFLCEQLTQLKAGGSYININGYADAIWDLKIILKDDYGIDVPEFKKWTPSPPTGEPVECPYCCECDEKCHAFFDDGHECNKTYQRSKCPYCHPEPGEDQEAVKILKELCKLKHYKDTVGKDAIYEQKQPELWKRANDFLNSLP